MMNGPGMRGFLLKRNAEHRKANLIGSKYKRRWVELTGQTLVYAATQQDLLAGKVFAIREMKWVKTDGESKFQVRFPERVLTFKVEAGGRTERDTWVAALEQSKQMGAEAGRRGASAEKLEQLKKTAEDMLMEEGDEGSSSSIAAHRGPGAAAVRSYALPAGLPHVGSSRSTETGHRPPSPRSLLASAKAGSMFVTNTTAGSMSAPAASSAHSSLDYQQQHNADDDAHDDSDDEARCGRMPACVRQGSLERAAQKHDSGNSTGSGSMHPHAAAAAVAALAVVANHESPAGSGSSTPRRRRESLQRRLTPGVMLINTSPSTPTAADAAQDPASSTAQPSPACSSQASPGSISPARHAHQQPHQQQRACRSPPHSPACQADSSSDDILTLDPDELAEDSRCSNHSTASRSPAGTAALALASSGSLSGGARPGTAPSYRPGTPLKSCMRGGGSSNSSSSSLPYVGSASTPASSAEAAAAAAAALASLGLQPRHGAPSPLSGKAAAGQQGLPDKHGNGGGRDWVEADWDESSEDDEGPGPSHSAQQVRSSGAGVTLAASSKAAPGVCNAGAALVGVRGVKADNNWLDDDFDS